MKEGVVFKNFPCGCVSPTFTFVSKNDLGFDFISVFVEELTKGQGARGQKAEGEKDHEKKEVFGLTLAEPFFNFINLQSDNVRIHNQMPVIQYEEANTERRTAFAENYSEANLKPERRQDLQQEFLDNNNPSANVKGDNQSEEFLFNMHTKNSMYEDEHTQDFVKAQAEHGQKNELIQTQGDNFSTTKDKEQGKAYLDKLPKEAVEKKDKKDVWTNSEESFAVRNAKDYSDVKRVKGGAC